MDRVREAMRHAWRGYREHAWGHDELKPLSRAPHDWYGAPLLVTPVDAYDTLHLMGLREEAATAKELILERLSFDLDVSVQGFEVNIRLLGGLLAAHQLDGGFLDLAADLGERLLPAFDSPTGMPYRFVNLKTGKAEKALSNPAEIGTYTLEFGVLSRLTGDPRYFAAAKRASEALFSRRSALGLLGSAMDVQTGEWRDARSHVGGGIDSYFEYLLKGWLLFGDEDFLGMWETCAEALHRHVAHGEWYGVVDMHGGERIATRFGALQCFFPGLLALAGDLPRAERLMASVERIGPLVPEAIDYASLAIAAPAYELRPEAIESAWYLHRHTGKERYRELGLAMFDALERRTRVDAGFAALADVRTEEKKDRMHSFLLAETFKYAYLLLEPGKVDGMILTTEAHPLKA